jgi:hypothetical protein
MKIRSLNLGAARTTARAAKTPDGAAMEVRYPGMAAIELTETVLACTQRCAAGIGERDEAFSARAPVWLSRSAQRRYDETNALEQDAARKGRHGRGWLEPSAGAGGPV